jgi:hypothetical protein
MLTKTKAQSLVKSVRSQISSMLDLAHARSEAELVILEKGNSISSNEDWIIKGVSEQFVEDKGFYFELKYITENENEEKSFKVFGGDDLFFDVDNIFSKLSFKDKSLYHKDNCCA